VYVIAYPGVSDKL